MAVSQKGKFFMLRLVLIFGFCIYVVVADSVPVVTVTETETETETEDGSDIESKVSVNEALDVLKQQQIQLEKMEDLVKRFTELLSRLEQQFPEPPKVRSLAGNVETDTREVDVSVSAKKMEGGELEIIAEDGGSIGAMSVTKFSPFWSDRFQFVSAVKVGSNPTFINVLPPRDFEGFSKYVAVGDDRGRVYLVARSGDVMVQFDTLSQSPVTAMVSFISVYKNESILVTGHEDGNILMHRVWEDSSGDEWNSLRMETIVRFDAPEDGDGSSSITNLEVHHVAQKRYILSTNLNGKIRVFRDNGTVYGVASPTSRPLAFLKQRLLFLTETGAGSLDLRTMKIREAACDGLNTSVIKNYVFDATERSKAYGFTSDGDLIHVLLLGDIMNFKCRIRSKRKFDVGEPVTFQAIKGYLLIGNDDSVFVYNVSSQHYVSAGRPKFMFSAAYDGILLSFLYQQKSSMEVGKRASRPILASNHERLVILSLGGGYVAMFQSNLPVFKNEFNTMQWTSPVLLFILFLFGAWHFFAQKKDVLTSWGPDDPFSSAAVTSGSPVRPASNDRSLTDSSRNADVVDLRGTDKRGPSRRYVSPTQYPGGAVNIYRSGSTDAIHANPISTSVEPNFLKNQELKYRGSNLENAAFPNRRESLFLSSQVVDDKS